jgi:hypothetical protein
LDESHHPFSKLEKEKKKKKKEEEIKEEVRGERKKK